MEEIDKNHDIIINAGLDLYYDIKTNYEKLRVDTSDFCVNQTALFTTLGYKLQSKRKESKIEYVIMVMTKNGFEKM